MYCEESLGDGALEVQSSSEEIFSVKGQRVKHYYAGDPILDLNVISEEEELCLDSGQSS